MTLRVGELKKQLKCFTILSEIHNLVLGGNFAWWKTFGANFQILPMDIEQNTIARSENDISGGEIDCESRYKWSSPFGVKSPYLWETALARGSGIDIVGFQSNPGTLYRRPSGYAVPVRVG
jgi:hypothetical protein